jgi:hypothetical protein
MTKRSFPANKPRDISSRRTVARGSRHTPLSSNGAIRPAVDVRDDGYAEVGEAYCFDDGHVEHLYEDEDEDATCSYSSEDEDPDKARENQIDKDVADLIHSAGFKRLHLDPPKPEAAKLMKRFDRDKTHRPNVSDETPDCVPLWPRPADGRQPYWLAGSAYSAFHHPTWSSAVLQRV